MLDASDVRGICAMPITPTREGGDRWDATDTVELDVSAKMTDDLVQAGVGSFALCGTTGEGWGLSLDEKKAFIGTVIETNAHRVPIFAGATALGTRETIREMRIFRDMGAEGAFVGLPLWQTPTMENSVRFLEDLSEAVPDMPIMAYANSRVFKWSFPTEFWEAVALRVPTVVACKIAYGIEHLSEDVRVAGHRIRFMPNDRAAVEAYRQVGEHLCAIWATSVCMGPEPAVALMDAILAADDQRIGAIDDALKALPPPIPPGKNAEFASYNAQAVKAAANAAGYLAAGPMRPPYHDLPDEWQKLAESRGKAWAKLRAQYAR